MRAFSLATSAVLLCALQLTAASLGYIGSASSSEAPFDFHHDHERTLLIFNDSLHPVNTVFFPDTSRAASYEGHTRFGRLASRASVASAADDDSMINSSLSVYFTDTLNIGGVSTGAVLLDYSVHGFLDNGFDQEDVSIGFFHVYSELLQGLVTDVTFNTVKGVPFSPNPFDSFELTNGRWEYKHTGTAFIPFENGSVDIAVALRAIAGCRAPCSVQTDLGSTALIGGYRILDAQGNVTNAILTSASGYDYITPPGDFPSSTAPEPMSVALTFSGVAAFVLKRRYVE